MFLFSKLVMHIVNKSEDFTKQTELLSMITEVNNHSQFLLKLVSMY